MFELIYEIPILINYNYFRQESIDHLYADFLKVKMFADTTFFGIIAALPTNRTCDKRSINFLVMYSLWESPKTIQKALIYVNGVAPM